MDACPSDECDSVHHVREKGSIETKATKNNVEQLAYHLPLDLRVEGLLWRFLLCLERPHELVSKQTAAPCHAEQRRLDRTSGRVTAKDLDKLG